MKEVISMKSYTLKKVNGAPDWDAISAVEIDIPYGGVSTVQAWGKLCWDETGIYVNLRAKEAEIRCEELEPLSPVCEDSCLEFFIRPTEALNYFNFEYNFACNVFLGYGSGKNDLIRLIMMDQKDAFRPKSYRTEDGWGITYHIPFTFIRQFFPAFEAYEGLQFYGNFYRSAEKAADAIGMSWNPIDPNDYSFHCPKFYGQLILGGE